MLQQLRPALLSVFCFTVLTGLVFPLVVTGISQAAFSTQANGGLIQQNGQVIGSRLIGQPFAAPRYFHGRPSAAGNGYNAGKPGDAYAGSSGTNLGPTSAKLIKGIADDPATKDTDESYAGLTQLAKAYRTENGLPANAPLPRMRLPARQAAWTGDQSRKRRASSGTSRQSAWSARGSRACPSQQIDGKPNTGYFRRPTGKCPRPKPGSGFDRTGQIRRQIK